MLSKVKFLLATIGIIIFVTLIVTKGNVSYLSLVLHVRHAFMGDGSGGGHGIISQVLRVRHASLGDGSGGGHGIIRAFLSSL